MVVTNHDGDCDGSGADSAVVTVVSTYSDGDCGGNYGVWWRRLRAW